MTTGQFIIELLKALLNTPIAIAVSSITFMVLFKPELKGLINRIRSVEFPGGSVTTSQAQMSAVAALTESASPPQIRESSDSPADVKLTLDDQKRLGEVFDAETARASFWEYQFLNRFLVLNTQRILDWLAGLPQRTTVQMFDAFWNPLIPSPVERQAILSALENHHLISISGALIEVTPKGRDYIQVRGPLPPAL